MPKGGAPSHPKKAEAQNVGVLVSGKEGTPKHGILPVPGEQRLKKWACSQVGRGNAEKQCTPCPKRAEQRLKSEHACSAEKRLVSTLEGSQRLTRTKKQSAHKKVDPTQGNQPNRYNWLASRSLLAFTSSTAMSRPSQWRKRKSRDAGDFQWLAIDHGVGVMSTNSSIGFGWPNHSLGF